MADRGARAGQGRRSRRCSHGGMLFEELGFRYLGPIDGHDLPALRRWLERGQGPEGPGPAARAHRQGARRAAGERGPGHVPHAAGVREGRPGPHDPVAARSGGSKAYTDAVSAAIYEAMQDDPQGRGHHRRDVPGEQAREGPRRLPRPVLRRRHLRVPRRRLRRRAWPRPACGRSSTSTARSCSGRSTRSSRKSRCRTCRSSSRLDRAGLTGPDGPTHHGTFDIAVHAALPEHGRHGPRRRARRRADAATSPWRTTARSSIRYPKANLETVERGADADRAGPGRGPRVGRRRHAPRLRHAVRRPASRRPSSCAQEGLRRRRHQRPLRQAARPDDDPARRSRNAPFVVTVEEGHARGRLRLAPCWKRPTPPACDTRNVVRLGIPDRFVEHAERDELLADLGLDVDGICATVRRGCGTSRRSRAVAARSRRGRETIGSGGRLALVQLLLGVGLRCGSESLSSRGAALSRSRSPACR